MFSFILKYFLFSAYFFIINMRAILNQITPSKFFLIFHMFDKKFFILFLFSPIIDSFNLFLLFFCHNNYFFIFSIIKNNNCLYSKIFFNLMILGWPITLNKKYIFFYIYSSLFYQIFVCRKIRKSYKSKKMFQYFSEKRFISKLFFTY